VRFRGRPRPLLYALFTIAVALIAWGYGLMAGTAHGHADAMEIYKEGQEMTLKEFMNDPELIAAVREQLTATFEDVSGERAPDPEESIEAAIRIVRVAVAEQASDQSDCNKIDECRAKAIVLERFAEWLGSEAA
jgi:hypothetical protein